MYQGFFHEIYQDIPGQFDLIVLFDVLEHLSLSEIVASFKIFSHLLTPSGKVLARFPNGGSPFGRLHQYGDATHQTVLTGSLIHQIALTAGMELIQQFDAARPLIAKDRKGLINIKWVVKLVYWLGDCLTIFMSLIFYGKTNSSFANVNRSP